MIWLKNNPEIAAVIIALIGTAVGYIYRARSEKRENLCEALYLLLEIWYRFSLQSKVSLSNVFESLSEKLKEISPDIIISDQDIKASHAYFGPIIQNILKTNAQEDFDGVREAYARVIKLVSKSDPIFAYRLESASSIQKRLTSLDQYFKDALSPLTEKQFITDTFSQRLQTRLEDYSRCDERFGNRSAQTCLSN